jgi:hypothetical protein
VNHSAAKTISRIQDAVQSSESIPASEVKSWLRHPSLDVLSAATDLILAHSRRIEPPLTIQEFCESVRNYYWRCLREDRETEIVPSIHIAGQEFVQWFRSLWNDPDVPRNYLADLKTMLAQLYRASDRERADRLVNAIIEHLFETPEIAEFFSDWKSDPVLARGFARAMEWVERSPTQS